jgi:hypothetical protein
MISAVRIHFPAQSKVLYDNWFEVQGRQYSYASWQDMALTPDESGAVFAGHFTIPWTVDGLAFKTFVADGSYPIELQGFDMSGSLVARSKVNIIVQGGMTFVLGQ